MVRWFSWSRRSFGEVPYECNREEPALQGEKSSPQSVIPGWCVSTRPGISRFRVRCFASPRNDAMLATHSRDSLVRSDRNLFRQIVVGVDRLGIVFRLGVETAILHHQVDTIGHVLI